MCSPKILTKKINIKSDQTTCDIAKFYLIFNQLDQ